MKHILYLIISFAIIACGEQNTANNTTKSIRKQRWNLASSFPKSLNSFWDRIEGFSTQVTATTNKELTIKCYQPGEMVPALEVFDAVSQGSIEMGVTAGNYYMGKNNAFVLDTGLPFGLTCQQKNAWLYEAGGLELIQNLYKKYNIMYFPIGNTTTQMGGWFRNEITSLEDLQGLRVRISGLGGKVYDKMGATVQMIGGGEIYSALEQGSIDGAEFVGPYDDEKFGFQNVAKYYYAPGWQEPGATIALYINLERWMTLSTNAQEIIAMAAKNANLLFAARYDKENPAALKRLIDQGVELRHFPNEILAEAKKQTDLLIKEYCKDPEFNTIYTSIKKFKETSNAWSKANALHYINFATTGIQYYETD